MQYGPIDRFLAVTPYTAPARAPVAHLLTALAAMAMLAGCVAPTSVALDRQVPATWMQAASSPASASPRAVPSTPQWWKAWNDPTLDALVDEALSSNLDVAQAQARLRQQRTLTGAAPAAHRPALSTGARTVQDVSATDSYFQASIDMVWDIGLFGAAQADERSAQARLTDAAAKLQAARVSVVAEVVHRYLDIRLAQCQRARLREISTLDDEASRLAAVRLQQRIGTQDELLQWQAQAQDRRAALSQLVEKQARSAHALAVLVGRMEPDSAWLAEDASATLPDTRAMVPAELPADLLRNRPDVRQAEAAVEEAAGDVGLARSALYPRFQLVGSLLYSYNLTSNRRSSSKNLPVVGPAVDIPLFDWGRRRAQVDASEQGLQAAILAYRQSVLQGVAEVESSLAALSAQREREQALVQSSQLTEQRLERESTRARLGLGSEWASMPDRIAAVQTRAEIDTTRASQALALVAVYKALGSVPPAIDTPALADADASTRQPGTELPKPQEPRS